MAAIDKIYLSSFDTFTKFKEWCDEQPPIKDKYGREERISDYLFIDWYNPKYWENEGGHPVMNAPYFIDAYIIRNCPIEEVQKELMLNYGHKTQEDLRNIYNIIKNRKPEIQKIIDEANGDYPKFPTGVPVNDFAYWYWNINDFNIDENGVISIKGAGKSDYEMMKDGELYASPACDKYERGKHFKITKIPTLYKGHKCNYPISYKKHTPSWFVHVKLPDYVEEKYMSWSSHSVARFPVGTWDFTSEYVVSYDGWSSSSANCKSIRALTRRITKWNLPVGTVITVTGMYVGEEYEIVVKK
jgi:hypothetical protein